MKMDIYKDITGLYTQEECDADNVLTIDVPDDLVYQFFIENIMEDFKGDDPEVSERGLFEEWLDEYTCDETIDLWEYVEQNREEMMV